MRTLAFLSLAALVAVPGLASAEAKTFEVSALDSPFSFTVVGYSGNNPTLTVAPGDVVTVNLKLAEGSSGPHNWVIDGIDGAAVPSKNSYVLTGNTTATGTFTAPAEPGTFTYYCLPHQSAGMKGTFTVASATTGGDTEDGMEDGAEGDMEETEEKKSPGVELVGALAVVGAAAVLATRRRA